MEREAGSSRPARAPTLLPAGAARPRASTVGQGELAYWPLGRRAHYPVGANTAASRALLYPMLSSEQTLRS